MRYFPMWRMLMLSMPVLLLCSAADARDAPSGTAENLNKFCQSKDRDDVTMCTAYLGGFVSGLMLGTVQTKAGKPFCVPDGVTARQIVRIFERFARDHPEQLKRQQDGIAAAGLMLAFP